MDHQRRNIHLHHREADAAAMKIAKELWWTKTRTNAVLSGRKGDIEDDSPDEDPDDFNEEDEANNLLKCRHCGEPIPLEGQQCAHCHCAHCSRVSEVAFSIDRS